VEAVRRRGWDAVEVEGDPDFRRAVAQGLAALDPPVAIADSPLGRISGIRTAGRSRLGLKSECWNPAQSNSLSGAEGRYRARPGHVPATIELAWR
jgi:hypothetical protein